MLYVVKLGPIETGEGRVSAYVGFTETHALPAVLCEDPDDDKYLAAAVEGRASHVVTGDRRFLAVGELGGV